MQRTQQLGLRSATKTMIRSMDSAVANDTRNNGNTNSSLYYSTRRRYNQAPVSPNVAMTSNSTNFAPSTTRNFYGSAATIHPMGSNTNAHGQYPSRSYSPGSFRKLRRIKRRLLLEAVQQDANTPLYQQQMASLSSLSPQSRFSEVGGDPNASSGVTSRCGSLGSVSDESQCM